MKQDDIVTAAIARAKTKLAMSEDKKIAANIQSLSKRLTIIYKELNEAKIGNSDQIDLLQENIDRLKHEIDTNRKLLKKLRANISVDEKTGDNE